MILDYNSFVMQREINEQRRQMFINIFNQFEELKPVMNEATILLEAGVFDFGSDMLLEDFLNEDNLVQKMKQKFDNAIAVAKEKGKAALSAGQEKIIKLGGSIGNVIKLIVDKLKEWMGAAFGAAKAAYSKAANAKASDIKDKISNMGKNTKNELVRDVKQMKAVTSAVGGWIASGFAGQVAKAGAVAAKEDVKESFELDLYRAINEAILSGEIDFTDMIDESEGGHGIPFVSAIAHKFHHIPPFNLLDKVKQGVEKIAGGALARFSYYATQIAGAPGPYEFAAIAAIIGILGEVQVKGIAKHAILHVIPGLGLVLSIISNVAMCLAVIGIIETVIKAEEDSHGEAAH
jgi:hypothetical protein